MKRWLTRITKYLEIVYGERFVDVHRYKLVRVNGVEKFEVQFNMMAGDKSVLSFEIITRETLDL